MEELFAPRPAKPVPAKPKKMAASSDLSSTRGSEDRQTPVTGRGQKRGRDHDIEKVRDNVFSECVDGTTNFEGLWPTTQRRSNSTNANIHFLGKLQR